MAHPPELPIVRHIVVSVLVVSRKVERGVGGLAVLGGGPGEGAGSEARVDKDVGKRKSLGAPI